MKILKYICFSAIAFLSFSCEDLKDDASVEQAYLQDVLKSKERQREIDGFIIPDSINTALIVASYYEEEPKGNSIIVFSDTSKTDAIRIKFFSDHTSTWDKLKKISFNTFKSIHNGGEYVIKDKIVAFYYETSANATVVNDFERTDR
jgi:hypothetical protein